MSESFNTLSQKAGMESGALIHVGNVLEIESTIFLVDYSQDTCIQKVITSIEELAAYKEKRSVTWVNIEGLKNVKLIESIGKMFNIHLLVLEDILNTHQRPKLIEDNNYLYIVLKALSLEGKEFSVNYEQISILVLDHFIFTFKEKKDDLFSPIYKRLDNSKGRLRTSACDYLTYSIIDMIVDMNFIILDALNLATDAIEDELLSNPIHETILNIQQIKRELIYIRRSVSPLRELITALLRSDTSLIKTETHVYFRDIQDHVLHIIEEIETYRDILTGLLDIYISSVSNKMNEIMKVLTIFASIFIPLTFFVGVYGMNFEYMPELKWKWAYPTLWASFILFASTALFYFKKKKWI